MNLESFKNQVLPAKNKLYRFALRFVGDEEEAQDIVQEVFIRVWNGRDQVRDIQNWEAWCMRIARNLSLDRVRSAARKQVQPLEAGFGIMHTSPTPHESAEVQESMTRIAQFIDELPEKQRQVIHLRDIEGYTYNEICEIMELDMNQVKVSLFRARTAVREKLMKINAYGL